jgi:ribonuclease HII
MSNQTPKIEELAEQAPEGARSEQSIEAGAEASSIPSDPLIGPHTEGLIRNFSTDHVLQISRSGVRESKKLLSAEKEWRRLKDLSHFEDLAREKGFHQICGIDEVGRGPLAGPVVACACIIPPNILISGIDDSKKLTSQKREEIFKQLVQDARITYSIGSIDAEEIDRINIYQATIQAMLLAVSGLEIQPDYLLVDGLKLPHPKIPCEKIIKGDSRSQSIAAASIIAKVTRDRMMLEFDQKWPEYGFSSNKGYGTAKHYKALKEFGPCAIHRLSFDGVPR